MRKIDMNTLEIRTYDNGVLHFVIGSEYKAFGTCGEAKDKEVKGLLKIDNRFNQTELVLYSDYYGLVSINERTLSYL